MERLPAGETYALGSLFTPRSYLASVVESESTKQELHTTHYTTALGASQRPVLTHHTRHCVVNKITQALTFSKIIQTLELLIESPTN